MKPPSPSSPQPDAPPETPRESKRRQRRRIICDVARKVLVQEGPENFSMNRIAQTGGMRLSLLQYYFRNKNALIREMMRQMLENDRQEIVEAISSEGLSNEEKLEAALRAFLKNYADRDTCKIVTYFWLSAMYDAELMSYMDEWYVEYMRILGDLIGTLLKGADEHHANQIALMYLALMDGSSLMCASGGGRQKYLENFLPFIHEAMMGIARPGLHRESSAMPARSSGQG